MVYLEAGYPAVEKLVHKIMDLYEPEVEEWSKQLVKPADSGIKKYTFLAPPSKENGVQSSNLTTTSKKTTRILHSNKSR